MLEEAANSPSRKESNKESMQSKESQELHEKVSTHYKVARKISKIGTELERKLRVLSVDYNRNHYKQAYSLYSATRNRNSCCIYNFSSLSPEIFEGMAIGIENTTTSCLGVALAVVGHKWAEGLTLVIPKEIQ